MKQKIPAIYKKENVLIEKIVSGGYGLARLSNGKIALIKQTLPQEQVTITYKENNKDFVFGKVDLILESSPLRITPKCSLFGYCGGCQLQMASYQNQMKIKEKMIQESLSHIGKKEIAVLPIIESDQQFHYRNKGSFQVFQEGKIGFCKPGTTFPFAIEECPLMEDPINQRIKDYQNPESKAKLDQLKALNIRSNQQGQVIDSTIKRDCFQDHIEHLQFLVDIDTFFQVNRFIVPLWLKHIQKKVMELSQGKSLLDLFCGVGIIGQYLSPFFEKVVGIEINKRLIENGQKVLELNNIHNFTFVNQDASYFQAHHGDHDTVIVNPPRTGLPEFMTQQLITLRPPVVIYSSCNPDTFARDMALLIDHGHYIINEVQPFDMFPQTHHSEIVGIFYQK